MRRASLDVWRRIGARRNLVHLLARCAVELQHGVPKTSHPSQYKVQKTIDKAYYAVENILWKEYPNIGTHEGFGILKGAPFEAEVGALAKELLKELDALADQGGGDVAAPKGRHRRTSLKDWRRMAIRLMAVKEARKGLNDALTNHVTDTTYRVGRSGTQDARDWLNKANEEVALTAGDLKARMFAEYPDLPEEAGNVFNASDEVTAIIKRAGETIDALISRTTNQGPNQ